MFRDRLTLDGREGYTLLASCLGDDTTGGGLFAFDGSTVECVDRLSCTGLWASETRFARLLWCPSEIDSIGELLLYDTRGVERYLRIDALSDPHDILWDGQAFLVASASTNRIVRVELSGHIGTYWEAPGTGDVWHINCLLQKDGELYLSAFGRFREHREWVGKWNHRTGFVLNLTTGKDVLTGLDCPHHPRFFDGKWTISNSANHEVIQVDPSTGATIRRVPLKGWPKGIAVTDELILVGESAHRTETGPEASASIAVICRETWELLDRISLPSREVYDLVLVRPALFEGVRRGFRTNPLRVAETDQYAMFRQVGVEPSRLWATGDALPPEACRVSIEAVVPDILAADTLVDLECVVENRGSAFFVSAPPHPVHLSYRWIEQGSGRRLDREGERSRLPQALPPHQPLAHQVTVRTPPTPGEYILRLTLVQEQVAWFDDIDPTNASSHRVTLVESG